MWIHRAYNCFRHGCDCSGNGDDRGGSCDGGCGDGVAAVMVFVVVVVVVGLLWWGCVGGMVLPEVEAFGIGITCNSESKTTPQTRKTSKVVSNTRPLVSATHASEKWLSK